VLEARLKPFSVGDRAEIITEIKSHILSALERDPQANLDHVLAAFGEPETVANRYLLERGLKPGKPPISPVVKWLVIGFLGTMAMVLLFSVFLITKFSPMITRIGNQEGLEVLNELLDIESEENSEGRFAIKGLLSAGRFHGDLELGEQRAITVKFTNVKIETANSEDNTFAWECEGVGAGAPESEVRSGIVEFNLLRMIGARCMLAVPKGAKLSLDGTNAKVDLDRPLFNVHARIGNGKVEITPAEGIDYKYELTIGRRKKTSFVSSEKPDAFLLHVELNNGRISRGK
jgi:hypothetical protein